MIHTFTAVLPMRRLRHNFIFAYTLAQIEGKLKMIKTTDTAATPAAP
jgi:hypothetical protein